MSDEAPVLDIKVGPNTYRLDIDDVTGRDAQDFLAVVGLPLASAMTGDYRDLHVIAGLVWLARRRSERNLAYESVNKSLSYGMLRRGELDVVKPEPEAVTDGPSQ